MWVKVKAALWAIGAVAAAVFAALLYRKGSADALAQSELSDNEHAAEICDRVERIDADSLRQYDDSGYRD